MTGISVTGLPYLKPDADAGNYDDDLYLTLHDDEEAFHAISLS